jgi:hypothetical protein
MGALSNLAEKVQASEAEQGAQTGKGLGTALCQPAADAKPDSHAAQVQGTGG